MARVDLYYMLLLMLLLQICCSDSSETDGLAEEGVNVHTACVSMHGSNFISDTMYQIFAHIPF